MSRDVLKERGAATVFVVAALALIMFIGTVGAMVSAVVVAHRRAQAAADLAAIAGASALDALDPCGAARSVALANGALLESCRPTTTDITVTVAVAGPAVVGRVLSLRAEARAGR